MHAEHHHHCHEHGGYHHGSEGRGAALFYGYCHESGRMRMMDYPDYINNLQTGYQNMYQNLTAPMQSYMENVQALWRGGRHHHDCGCGCRSHEHEHEHHHHDCGCGCRSHEHEHHHHDCGCGCRSHEHEHGHHHHDCHCSCCIKCADAVEYARCGELRQIPITLENDTRRERDVKLQLGAFVTGSGKELGWQATLSETEFKLGPCGEKTVLLRVPVDCSKFGGGTQTGTTPPAGTVSTNEPGAVNQFGGSVDDCKVAYATLRAEGCTIRPIVIAVAVLPNDCGAHEVGCGCGCCH